MLTLRCPYLFMGTQRIWLARTPLALSDGILADHRVAVLLCNLIYSYTSLYPPVQPLWRLNYLEHFKPPVRSAVLS